MSKFRIIAASVAALVLAACTAELSVEEVQSLPDGLYPVDWTPETIVATLPGGDGPQTRTSLDYSGRKLKTSWKAGDIVSVVPAAHSKYAGTYQAVGNGSSATFSVVSSVTASSGIYTIYYPGDKIKNDYAYVGFSYNGQVQSKSDPMAHLSDYQAMRVVATDYSEIDFSSADQSSCMRFSLSGMTFDTPSKITMSALRGDTERSVFFSTNFLDSYYPDDSTGQGVPSTPMVSSLSLYLSGYGSAETSITAFMMMANDTVSLAAGDIVRVSVTCADDTYYTELTLSSALTLTGGHCHSFVRSSGWQATNNPSGNIDIPDYTEYEYDKDVVVLQEGSKEKLNIVLLGDGFIDADFQDGTYDALMRKVYSSLFDIAPYSSFKDRFNVSYVKAVSPQRTNAINTGLNGATNTGTVTKFSTTFTENSTATSGDLKTAWEYAKCALGENANSLLWESVVIVVANQRCHAGTCHMSWYTNSTDHGNGVSVVFMGMGADDDDLKALVHHEALGHGFGKLADEYYYEGYHFSDPTSKWRELQGQHALGLYRNVDIYVTQELTSEFPVTRDSTVYWSALFDTDNKYEKKESLGIFEGAHEYDLDFCRPTEDGSRSIMHENSGFFNAPSRRAIIYRLRHLSGEVSGNKWGDVTEELNPFLEWDAENFLPTLSTSASAAPASVRENKVERKYMHTPPVLHPGHLENGRFVEDKL